MDDRAAHRAERTAVTQGMQGDADNRAQRKALHGDAVPRDVRRGSGLHTPDHRLAVLHERLAVVAQDLEHELRMIAAGNESRELAGHRLALLHVVHRERVMRDGWTRETCKGETEYKHRKRKLSHRH